MNYTTNMHVMSKEHCIISYLFCVPTQTPWLCSIVNELKKQHDIYIKQNMLLALIISQWCFLMLFLIVKNEHGRR